MKTDNIQVDKVFNNFEWAGINLIWGAWTWAILSEAITWGLGIIGALTLIWFNVERALKARKERTLLDKPTKSRRYGQKED
jgi:hypothetical protein